MQQLNKERLSFTCGGETARSCGTADGVVVGPNRRALDQAGICLNDPTLLAARIVPVQSDASKIIVYKMLSTLFLLSLTW